MERLAEFLRRRRLRVLAVAGLLLAAATFVRPVAYYLPWALALGLFLVLVRVPGLRWKAPAVLLISVLPWLAAWQIRNRVETGYSGFSSISEVNLYFHISASVLERVEHRSYNTTPLGYSRFCICNNGQSYLYEPYVKQHPEQAGWNQAQRLAFMHSEATRVIREHFGTYLLLCLRALFRTLVEPGTMYLDHQLALYPEQYARTTG
jgi:membrane protein implicated in regulation of membrane protease activity